MGRGVQPPHIEHPAPKLHRLNSLESTSACRLPCCQLSRRITFPVCSLCCSPCSRARRLQAVLDTAAKVTFQMQVCLCTSSAQSLCWVRAHSGEQPCIPPRIGQAHGTRPCRGSPCPALLASLQLLHPARLFSPPTRGWLVPLPGPPSPEGCPAPPSRPSGPLAALTPPSPHAPPVPCPVSSSMLISVLLMRSCH